MIYEKKKPTAEVVCTFMQIYNEKIYDLLNDDATFEDNLKLRWEEDRDFVV